MSKPLQTYKGPGIEVSFDPNLCRHTGICVRGLPAVFDVKRKRWIRPELSSAEEVAAQVSRCQSGALQYRWRGGAARLVSGSRRSISELRSGRRARLP
jgi:uncharacterized Fe-S cluster protein YjdI